MAVVGKAERCSAVQPGDSFDIGFIVKLRDKRRRVPVITSCLPLPEISVIEICSCNKTVQYFSNDRIVCLDVVFSGKNIGKNGCQQNKKDNRENVKTRNFHEHRLFQE